MDPGQTFSHHNDAAGSIVCMEEYNLPIWGPLYHNHGQWITFH